LLRRPYYEKNKQFESALNACNSALKLNPNDGESNIYLGFTYLSLDKTETANEYFRKAGQRIKGLHAKKSRIHGRLLSFWETPITMPINRKTPSKPTAAACS
jgi:tetratricopeptide (TPR) repeat protein